VRHARIDPEIRPLLEIGEVEAGPVRVAPAGPALLAEIQALANRLSAAWSGRPPSEIEGLTRARRLYRAFGIDPTSTRPSSEALVRRVLQGKAFPEVNAAVDVANLCSASFLLPIGLYDADKIRGEVVLRRGRAEESYAGIRKDTVGLEGRPVLADDLGPFGNPTSDSLRTCVEPVTTALWMVIFAPSAYPAADLAAHVAFADAALRRHLVGGMEPAGAS
jgi:DNA/RNA-binding domain of Phe-tRNA-synthetase-like protein